MLHGLAHPGVKATVKMITQRFVWPNIKADCQKWTQACIPSQKAKIHRHTRSQHIRTTAYHPAANGMIERLHRQLKAAIKAHETEAWTKVLSVILLGIRAAIKEDLGATPAELVYGETIRLPGQLLEQQKREEEPTNEFVRNLQQTMTRLRPQIRRHGNRATFVHKDRAAAERVFIRHDAPTKALQPPYDDPYKVLERSDKMLKVQINGKPANISIDRLKPAYIMEEPTEEQESLKTSDKQEPQKTRSGRPIKPTVRVHDKKFRSTDKQPAATCFTVRSHPDRRTHCRRHHADGTRSPAKVPLAESRQHTFSTSANTREKPGAATSLPQPRTSSCASQEIQDVILTRLSPATTPVASSPRLRAP
ncbi:uncharacterized protein [Linepithema humile]|uniref:uncharacterized protein n=1 Tax=Linepithema humile TaxID=83485 RepID=UPI00351F64ED